MSPLIAALTCCANQIARESHEDDVPDEFGQRPSSYCVSSEPCTRPMCVDKPTRERNGAVPAAKFQKIPGQSTIVITDPWAHCTLTADTAFRLGGRHNQGKEW
jgi:hypothetical protein